MSGSADPDTRRTGGAIKRRPRHLDDITSDLDVKDVIGVLDQPRAGAFSGRAVVRVAGGFRTDQ